VANGSHDLPVLIAGAGPVALTAAYALLRQNIPVQLFDIYATVPSEPRASTFHPPTVELLEEIGVAEELLSMGLEVRYWQQRDRRKGLVAELDLHILSDITRYPYRLHCEQHKYAGMLLRRVEEMSPGCVHRNSRVLSARQDADAAYLTVETPTGTHEVKGRYLIGADGGRSIVRHSLGVSFEGKTFEERFLVLTTPFDFGPYGFTGTCYIADPVEWCSMFRVPADGPPGRWRVVFPESSGRPEAEVFNEAECQARLQNFFPHPDGKDYQIVHKNIYQVHQRIAGKFRVGHVFLAGDAAHINNPLGGMGLNFGIHDALNAADKIGQVWRGEADETVFDRYDRQRRTVAEEYLLAQTAQNKRDLEERDPVAREKRQEEWRQTAADPKKARAFLLKTAMFESVRRAREIL